MRAMGLAVASGVVYVGTVDGTTDGSLPMVVSDAPARVNPAANLGPSQSLSDFASRFRQSLRDVQPDRVVLVATRKYGQWSYRSAYDRIAPIAAIMLQCSEEQIPFAEAKTDSIAASLDLKAARLQEFDPARVGLVVRPAYWNAGRGEAFAAAVWALDAASAGAGS